jgi:hypothetical protein
MRMRDVEVGIEEFILAAIIILNILAVSGLLTPDLDYIKKIISWSALGLLLYQAQPSKILCGHAKPFTDILLLFGYFFLFIKNFISIANHAEASAFTAPLYEAMQTYATTIELVGIYLGVAILLYSALRLALHVKTPSVMHLLHADTKNYVIRSLISILVVFGFFIVVFSLVMEWLAIAIDAPLLMIGLGVYFFFIIKHRTKFSPGSFLQQFGDFGGEFYKNVIEHLKYKSSILKVISGMLILHLVTDTLIFIWAHISGISEELYFGPLGRTQLSLFTTLQQASILEGFHVLLNLGTLLFLFIFPVFLWFDIYKNKNTTLHPIFLGLSSAGIVSLLLVQTVQILPIEHRGLYGVDIIFQFAQAQLWHTLVVLAVGLITWVGAYFFHKRARQALVIISTVFLSLYVAMYYTSSVRYFLTIIPVIAGAALWVLLAFFLLQFLLTTVFYIVGMISYLVEAVKHAKEHIKVE